MQDMVDGGRVPDAPTPRRPGLEPGPITTAANGLKATASPLNDHRRSVRDPAQGRNDGCSAKIVKIHGFGWSQPSPRHIYRTLLLSTVSLLSCTNNAREDYLGPTIAQS